MSARLAHVPTLAFTGKIFRVFQRSVIWNSGISPEGALVMVLKSLWDFWCACLVILSHSRLLIRSEDCQTADRVLTRQNSCMDVRRKFFLCGHKARAAPCSLRGFTQSQMFLLPRPLRVAWKFALVRCHCCVPRVAPNAARTLFYGVTRHGFNCLMFVAPS